MNGVKIIIVEPDEKYVVNHINEMVDVIRASNVYDFVEYADMMNNIPGVLRMIDRGRKFIEKYERYEDCAVLRDAFNKLIKYKIPCTTEK